MPDTLTQPVLTIRGEAEDRDDDWLLLASLLLIRDVEEARRWWATIAPPAYRTMLTGKEWTYNPDLMQWSRGKRSLTSEAIKLAVLLAVAEAHVSVNRITRQMVSGRMLLQDWQGQMLQIVKRTQVAVAAVACGGVDQLPAVELGRSSERLPADPAEVKTTGDMVAYQADRLQRFAEQIEAGHEKADTADKIERRALLYVDQAIAGYEEARRRTAAAIGVTEAINVLDAEAEHCRPDKRDPLPDCPSISRAGWMALEAMPPIGLRRCRMKCRCQLRFRLADGTELP